MKQKYIGTLVLPLLISTTVLFAEPSVYGFSTANSGQGNYSDENIISSNRKTIASLKRQLNQQNERIDGLTSIIEGLSASIAQLRGAGTQYSSSDGGDENTALLRELGTMIDKINNDYVSKDELREALKGDYKPSSKNIAKNETSQVEETQESLQTKETSKLYSEGVRLFANKRYDEAKKRFDITDIKGYKPAASNYYLGEIGYYTKQYEDAIFYFKKSAGLHDGATYIDTLLLHTAVSLERSGDKDQARAFYENIISNYAGKRSADIAKEKLKRL